MIVHSNSRAGILPLEIGRFDVNIGGESWRWPKRDKTLESHEVQSSDAVDDEQRVFKRRADLKILASRIAMHLSPDLRNKLFGGIDRLYDEENYVEGEDAPILSESYRSFLRFVIYSKVSRPPALGVSREGHLLAAWIVDGQKLFLEFLAKDRVRLSAVLGENDEDRYIETCNCRTINALKFITSIFSSIPT